MTTISDGLLDLGQGQQPFHSTTPFCCTCLTLIYSFVSNALIRAAHTACAVAESGLHLAGHRVYHSGSGGYK